MSEGIIKMDKKYRKINLIYLPAALHNMQPMLELSKIGE